MAIRYCQVFQNSSKVVYDGKKEYFTTKIIIVDYTTHEEELNQKLAGWDGMCQKNILNCAVATAAFL